MLRATQPAVVTTRSNFPLDGRVAHKATLAAMNTHPLATFRAERELTQEALAQLLGVTKSSVSRIESGNQRPSPELAIMIRDLTGIALDELFERPVESAAE